MSGICDTCKRTTCEYRADDIAVCGLPKTETNWERLFGTPERAAQTLAGKCRDCYDCVLFDAVGRSCVEQCIAGDSDALLEWLKGGTE